jgi:hypothetical protein
MLTERVIKYLKNLYEKTFHESADESEEFIIFTVGNNPHPLRIKVEEHIIEMNQDPSTFLDSSSVAYELDAFVTTYIDVYE